MPEKSKVKIAIIVPGGIGIGHRSEGAPGLSHFVDNLAEFYNVTVISLVKTNSEFLPTTYKLIALNCDRNDHFFRKAFHFFPKFKSAQNKNKFDIVHGFWLEGSLLASITGKFFAIPIIVSAFGGEGVCIKSITYGNACNFIRRWVLNLTYKLADKVVFETYCQLKTFQKNGIRVVNPPVIPFGVDTDQFVIKPRSFSKGSIQFLHVANLNPVKDQKTLLKCFKEFHNKIQAKLTIIGHDTLDGELQQFARKLEISRDVQFLGVMSHAELPLHYQNSDIFLLTSMYESQCVSALEAMACGTVVIGTRVGLIADLEDDCTLAVDIGDEKGLVEKVLSLIENPEKYRQLQERGSQWAKSHDINYTVNQYSELYKTMIAEDRG